jgi:hypothetical protein
MKIGETHTKQYLQLLRIRHWIKNILIFIRKEYLSPCCGAIQLTSPLTRLKKEFLSPRCGAIRINIAAHAAKKRRVSMKNIKTNSGSFAAAKLKTASAIALIAVIGFLIASCAIFAGAGGGGGSTNSSGGSSAPAASGSGGTATAPGSGGGASGSINGTWVSGIDQMRFDGRNFEVVQNDGRNLITKGTYTTNGGSVSLRITDMWGPALGSGFEQKWYSRSELIAAGVPDSYLLMSGTYTAASLVITWIGNTETFTKRGG